MSTSKITRAQCSTLGCDQPGVFLEAPWVWCEIHHQMEVRITAIKRAAAKQLRATCRCGHAKKIHDVDGCCHAMDDECDCPEKWPEDL